MQKTIGLACILTSLLLLANPSQADVSWNFVVTSMSGFQGNVSPPLPLLGGTLTVPDYIFRRGKLTYSFESISFGGNFEYIREFGNHDFYLEFDGRLSMPVERRVVPEAFSYEGLVGLTFSPSGKISGSIFDAFFDTEISMGISDNIVTNGYTASDDACLFVRNDFNCYFEGYWQLTSSLPAPHQVAEPSTAAILGLAVSLLGITIGCMKQMPISVAEVERGPAASRPTPPRGRGWIDPSNLYRVRAMWPAAKNYSLLPWFPSSWESQGKAINVG